jgi:acyl-homoserine-lactone acylase
MAKISRDKYGIPYIDANDFPDAVRAIAKCHAQDDFHTIQQWLLSARSQSGHTDDWDGPYVDFLCSFLNIRQAVTQNLHKVGSEYMMLVSEYCEELNRYATSHPDKVKKKSLFPILPEDLLTAHHLMEVLGIQLDKPFSYILKNKEVHIPSREGSNVIALGTSRTDSGSTMIGISPHQQLEGLFGFYEIHLKIRKEKLELHGFIFPCTFTIFMGTNYKAAWGFTANYPDMYTVFKARVKGLFRKYIWLDDEWKPLKRKWYINRTWLYGKFPVPIFKSVFESPIGTLTKLGGNYLHIQIPLIGQIIGSETNFMLSRAQAVNQIKEICFQRRFAYLNLVAIDGEDNMLFIHNAHELERKDASDHYRNFVDLVSIKQLMGEMYPTDNLVTVENPACDFIVSCNQSPFHAISPPLSSDGFKGLLCLNDNSRSIRIKQLIEARVKHTMESFADIMGDTKLILPIIRNIDFSELFSGGWSIEDSSACQEMLKILRTWNGVADEKSEGAAIFSLVFHKYKDFYVYSKNPDILVRASHTELEVCLNWAKKYYHEGMTLGDLQFLQRGNEHISIAGIPDSVSSIRPDFEKGTFTAEEGGAFKMMIDLKNKVVWTVHPYGSSSNEDSPHYTDQMQLYASNDFRRIVTFEDYTNEAATAYETN